MKKSQREARKMATKIEGKKREREDSKRNFAVNFHFCSQGTAQETMAAKGKRRRERGELCLAAAAAPPRPALYATHSCNISLSLIFVGQRRQC